MAVKLLSKQAQKVLRLPLVELNNYINKQSPHNQDLSELARELDGFATQCASLAAYINQRDGYGCGDRGHAAGVKHFNKVRTAVRKSLGYLSPKDDINF